SCRQCEQPGHQRLGGGAGVVHSRRPPGAVDGARLPVWPVVADIVLGRGEGRMPPLPDLLVQYGVGVLFAWAFAVQAGLPAPAIPMLVGAGALSGSGQMNLAFAVGATMLATLCADALWYALGRHMGAGALGALCRFSLDPDTFIRDAKERFMAHRMRYLVLA